NFKEGKNLGRNLNQQPGDHRISDRHLVDVAPLQFGEKRGLITHCFMAGGGNWTPSFWHKATSVGRRGIRKQKVLSPAGSDRNRGWRKHCRASGTFHLVLCGERG